MRTGSEIPWARAFTAATTVPQQHKMKRQHSILVLIPLFCLFFVASKAQDEPALPTLPDNFWTTIEVNIINKNYTTRRNEFYDYQNDRVRFDVYTQNSDYVEIYEVDKNLHYEILNFQTCQVRTIDGNMSRLIDSNHHLMNTSALFRFGASYNESYDGVFSVRGIWCNRWSSIINETREDGTWSAYTLYYYFSDPSWEIDEGNHPEFEVPIRAEIEGESFSNGTTSPFHHIYEFVFFQIGIPPSWYFDFPESFRCGSVMDHPLPELPNQFSTIVELNVVNKNYTSIIKEYYDYDNDRARYEFYRRGHSYVEIILPESGYSYQVTDGTKCVIRTLNSSSPFGDQTSHLRSVSQLFEFGSAYNETYEGIREVRGISCDYWISDIVEHDNRTGSVMNYTLGWYFSVDSWDSRSKGQHNHRIPIRAEINGITILSNGTSHPFYHVYEFIDFVPGAPDEDLFEHPGDVICRGPIGLALPVFPDTYSATVEFTDLNNNLTAVFTEYYDYESDRARYDYFYEDSSHIILVLPEKNLTYSISHGTYEHANDTTCQIHTADLSTLLPASDLWEFSSKYNETYQGTTTVRGIPCDFWSHKVDRVDGNVTFHLDVLYYFSIDSWEMRGAHTEHRVPVQFKAKGNMTEGTKVTQLNLIYSFVNFDPLYIPPNVFDLQPEWNCGAHEYLTYVGFLLDVPLKDFNSYTFTSGLEAMFNLTEEHVYIISATGNTTVWVEFTAGNQSELDSINKAIKEMEMAESPYKIVSYSQTSTLDCPDGCGHGYCHFGTCVCDDDFTGSTCDKEVSNSNGGLSAGGVIGILILGLFIGAAIGAFLVYVYLRRKIKDKMSRNMVALDERDENDQIPLEQ